jgi:hypothetical protein
MYQTNASCGNIGNYLLLSLVNDVFTSSSGRVTPQAFAVRREFEETFFLTVVTIGPLINCTVCQHEEY